MFLLVQKTKDRKAASRFFRKLMRGQERSPQMIVTDELPSYGVARRKVMPSSLHCNDRFANNRVIGIHLLSAENYRTLRNRSFKAWQQVTCV